MPFDDLSLTGMLRRGNNSVVPEKYELVNRVMQVLWRLSWMKEESYRGA